MKEKEENCEKRLQMRRKQLAGVSAGQ